MSEQVAAMLDRPTSSQAPLSSVFVVDGARTPFLKAGTRPGPFSAADLAVAAGRDLLQRLNLSKDLINEVILGCVMPRETEANIARIVGLRLGLPVSVPAWTVQRNCASGMQALDSARQSIQSGRADIVLAGGVEAMSRAPLLLSNELVNWLADFQQASLMHKLTLLSRWHWRYLKPLVALRCGLSDAVVNLSWMSGMMVPNQFMEASQSWIPHYKGKYTIETFVWDSISDPMPLAPRKMTEFIVY